MLLITKKEFGILVTSMWERHSMLRCYLRWTLHSVHQHSMGIAHWCYQSDRVSCCWIWTCNLSTQVYWIVFGIELLEQLCIGTTIDCVVCPPWIFAATMKDAIIKERFLQPLKLSRIDLHISCQTSIDTDILLVFSILSQYVFVLKELINSEVFFPFNG